MLLCQEKGVCTGTVQRSFKLISVQKLFHPVFICFFLAQDHVALKKNSVLQKHLDAVESTALKQGLPPEGFEILLKVALSGKFGTAFLYCWCIFCECAFPL